MALLTADPPPAAAAAAAAGEQWVTEACRVLMDAEGNVVTHTPQLLACAVVRLVEAADVEDAADGPFGGCHQELTRLHGCRPPGIAIDAYAARLLRYCKCSPVCYVAAFAYMMRLQSGSGSCGNGSVGAGSQSVEGCAVRVDSLTAHRLMSVGSIIATKFWDDKFYSNEHYAQVAGVPLKEWNAMELDMLVRLNWRVHVSVAELGAALRQMEALAGGHMLGQATGLPAGQLATSGAAPARSDMLTTAAAAEAEGEDQSSDTTAAAIGSMAARGAAAWCGSSEEDLQACAASTMHLPWAGAHAQGPRCASVTALGPATRNGSLEAVRTSAPQRRTRKRCDAAEQQHHMQLGMHVPQDRPAESACRA